MLPSSAHWGKKKYTNSLKTQNFKKQFLLRKNFCFASHFFQDTAQLCSNSDDIAVKFISVVYKWGGKNDNQTSTLSFWTFFTLSSTPAPDFTPQLIWPTNALLAADPSGVPLTAFLQPYMKVSLAWSHEQEVLPLVFRGLPPSFRTPVGLAEVSPPPPQVMFTLRPHTLIWSHWDGSHSGSADRGHNTTLLPV